MKKIELGGTSLAVPLDPPLGFPKKGMQVFQQYHFYVVKSAKYEGKNFFIKLFRHLRMILQEQRKKLKRLFTEEMASHNDFFNYHNFC